MFIKVKAENGLCNLKRECYFSEYTPEIAINEDRIISICDKYTFNGRITYVTVSMINGMEWECANSFEELKNKLSEDFIEFEIKSQDIEEPVKILINKKNVLYVKEHSFGTEIVSMDLNAKSVFVDESVDEVARRLE